VAKLQIIHLAIEDPSVARPAARCPGPPFPDDPRSTVGSHPANILGGIYGHQIRPVPKTIYESFKCIGVKKVVIAQIHDQLARNQPSAKALVEAPGSHRLAPLHLRCFTGLYDLDAGIVDPRELPEKTLVEQFTAIDQDGLPIRIGLIQHTLDRLGQQAGLVVRNDEDGNYGHGQSGYPPGESLIQPRLSDSKWSSRACGGAITSSPLARPREQRSTSP